ncbi:flagellar basal-body MS-ring/collar protein FliF [Ampullimonas aquatilis]|uniref:flagellar basal-body MS-ring/collar protein FliF n=1 Tax=Ampullimonas aquatilis TaxID=1341549 RepID=UPI003C783A29
MDAIQAQTPPAGSSLPMLDNFRQLPPQSKLTLLFGVPLVLAAVIGLLIWLQQPDYRVLFTNLTDKDGGAIVASLAQMNVQYKYSEGGTAILVPSDKVHDARLKLASQGLPKGSIVGFELLENPKLGMTQFQEQINYQRALEGELARSIQSLSAVQTARVHLAIPKQSVFMREQQKPTASVLLSVYPGRVLDRSQIAGIAHLVSSSLPGLPYQNVNIVDQSGSLLSASSNPDGSDLDGNQLNYVNQVEQSYSKRIIDILGPVVGAENVRAQVSADVDFSQTESTAESFKPNQAPDNMVIRSQQISQSSDAGAGSTPQGIPGALSNQPPGLATAPIAGQPGQATPTNPAQAAAAGGAATAAGSSRKDATTNYEVDKTVRHTRNAVGQIKRLSAAVVLNNKQVNGKAVPLTEKEIEQMTGLVREAIGFSKERGDTLNVTTAAYASTPKGDNSELAIWKDPENRQMAKEFGKMALIAGVVLYLIFGVLKPMIKNASKVVVPPPALPNNNRMEEDGVALKLSHDSQHIPAEITPSEAQLLTTDSLNRARTLAQQDPRVVANIVSGWVSGKGKE